MVKMVVALATVVIMCLTMVFAYAMAIIGVMFPSAMMRFSDNMGLDNSSAMFSVRAYVRDSSYRNLNHALVRNIDVGRNRVVIDLSRDLFEHYAEYHDAEFGADFAHNEIRRAYVRAMQARGRDVSGFITQLYRERPFMLRDLHNLSFAFFDLDYGDEFEQMYIEYLDRFEYFVYQTRGLEGVSAGMTGLAEIQLGMARGQLEANTNEPNQGGEV